MGTTADKLNKLLETKQAIKQAIIDKGVEMEDNTPFAQYPDCIRNIETGGGNPAYEVLYNAKTNNGTDYSNLFASYQGTELNLDSFDTSNVTNMNNMFSNCHSLTSLDVSNFNTSKVTDMQSMFFYCSSLSSLDLSNFDTSNVTEMGDMFHYCNNLQTLDISNWDTSKVTYMSYMFQNCYNLQTLDLSNFITSNVNNMYGMFRECYNLQTLDIRNWDTSSIEYGIGTDKFLGSCDNLRELRLDNCTNSTISKIINSVEFPTDAIDGVTRTIYCKESEAAGLVAPENWEFSYVD